MGEGANAQPDFLPSAPPRVSTAGVSGLTRTSVCEGVSTGAPELGDSVDFQVAEISSFSEGREDCHSSGP